ncbi:unnamed protein product, partial [Amoebophrya sp. A120]
SSRARSLGPVAVKNNELMLRTTTTAWHFRKTKRRSYHDGDLHAFNQEATSLRTQKEQQSTLFDPRPGAAHAERRGLSVVSSEQEQRCVPLTKGRSDDNGIKNFYTPSPTTTRRTRPVVQ